jgi:hypothetical protein
MDRAPHPGLDDHDPPVGADHPHRLPEERGRILQVVEQVLGPDEVLAARVHAGDDRHRVAIHERALDDAAGQLDAGGAEVDTGVVHGDAL